jgi:predicted RNase H-like nuclease (RuvC/YqgF family)
LDVTWPSIVNLSNNIYDFAVLAGGTDTSSYYANMLRWVGMYNEELMKPNPDQSKLNEYQQSIQVITKQMYDRTQTLHGKAEESKQALKQFEEATRKSQQTLHASSDQLSVLLEGESGEITELKKQIEASLKEIEDFQKQIDAGTLSEPGTPLGTNS